MFFQVTSKFTVEMSNEQKQRIQVPDALREVLLEFSIAYLLEQPGDVVDFAVEYFTKLQDSRRQSSYNRDNDRGSVDDSVMSQEDDDGKLRIDIFSRCILWDFSKKSK